MTDHGPLNKFLLLLHGVRLATLCLVKWVQHLYYHSMISAGYIFDLSRTCECSYSMSGEIESS